MLKQLNTQKGFTFIEVLLVLLVLVIVSLIISRISVKAFEKQAIEQFFKQVSLDIQQMQTLAMKEGVYTTIQFIDNNNTYKGFLHNEHNNPEFERTFPEGITLNYYSNLKSIKFNKFGDVHDFGKIIFFTPEGHREVIVNIEKGRLRINVHEQ